MTEILMPKATAVWLLDNTSLTFIQIANFTGMHILEIEAFANGEAGTNIKEYCPITAGFLTTEEVERCQNDESASLQITQNKEFDKIQKKKSKARYTPVNKRSAKPSAIAWLIKHYPNIKDTQIISLIGTTKATINKIKNDQQYYKDNVKSVNSPVEFGLCSKNQLDSLVEKLTN